MEWQPIETAPNENWSIKIDIWGGGRRYTDCFWGSPTYFGEKGETGWVYQSGCDCEGPVDDWVPNPLYWMLPPEPPHD